MGKLSMLIVVATLMALMLGSEGRSMQSGTFQVVQTDDIFGWLCQNSPMASSFNWCKATTTLAPTTAPSTNPSPTTQVRDSSTVKTSRTTKGVDTTTAKSSSTTEVDDSTPVQSTSPMSSSTDTTSEPTVLERGTWCQFDNGTYVTLGQTFMYTPCLLCQCTQTHDIRCHSLQCKATYCVDGTKAVVKDGECCPQCMVDTSTSCMYGGISFPQGSIIRNLVENIQCWCQSGSIECRAMATVTTTTTTTTTVGTYASMDYFTSSGNSGIYIVVVIICVLVILASLICCGCAVVYYYYYYQTQQSAQQAYDQYYSSAGWQPMGEDGQVVDESVLEKQAEAEQGQNEENYPTGSSEQYVPPPYAAYNGPYTNGNKH